MTSSHPPPVPWQWFSWLAAALDRRSASRFALLFLGSVPARRRRTGTRWIRAAKLSDPFQPCLIAVAAAGKRADGIAARLAPVVVGPLVATADRLTLALDDTPTPRSGPRTSAVGAGQQQVRFVWANIGAFQVSLWTFTMTETWSWVAEGGKAVGPLGLASGQGVAPPEPRGKRRAWRRALPGEEIRAVLRPGVTEAEIQNKADRMLNLAA
jgi:hypothetical protein